ncbi:MAG TPA: CopG family transcriptional regulator [Solirubrobacteraceae bacterium]|nr:CopG family transcriptional regulator [Solirubrobacteraceae bacterium]
MQRVQVQLTDEQVRDLKSLAREKGVSVSELLRRGADEMIRSNAPTRHELWERAMSVVGKYTSDGSDVARRHDDYLDEIYGS